MTLIVDHNHPAEATMAPEVTDTTTVTTPTASVIVYTKDKCPGCTATMRSLKRKNIAFETRSIEDTPGARDMIVSLGYMQAPVVIAGDDHWSGYNPDRIEALAARLN